jgi:CRISPR-associated protein Cas2
MRTVIAFDIHDDRKRSRVAQTLREYAARVQKSVFEGADLSRAQYLRMRSRVEGLVDPTTDSLRYYGICAACAARVEFFGVGPGYLDPPEPVEIV